MSDDPPVDPYLVALREDLKAYDNPEVYDDPTLPQIYKLHLWTSLLPGDPTVIRAEIDGDVLWDNLIETVFYLISIDPSDVKAFEKHGETLEEFRQNFEAEPRFANLRLTQWEFFLRHFPKLFYSSYEIAVFSSFMAVVLAELRQEPDEDLSDLEAFVRSTMEQAVGRFEKLIKQIVETRSSGRPAKVETGRPEIVRRVLLTARGMMGERRGKDAVPALKGVALSLGTTEAALRMALKRLRTSLDKYQNLPREPS